MALRCGDRAPLERRRRVSLAFGQVAGAALGIVFLAGCNGGLVFDNNMLGASADGGRDADAAAESRPAETDASWDADQPVVDASDHLPLPPEDASWDASWTTPIDVAPDTAPPAADAATDVPAGNSPDRPVERAADTGVDAVNDVRAADAVTAFVCATDIDCRLPGLHCLVTAAGQPGRCVECIGNGHCLQAGAKFCDPVANRCVECVVAGDCPSRSSAYPSLCISVPGRCLYGCEDDSSAAGCPTTRKYRCVEDDYYCVECLSDAECATSPRGSYCQPVEHICVGCLSNTCAAGLLCDPLSARCVECRTSKDCLSPTRPLCNPATLTCVAVPP